MIKIVRDSTPPESLLSTDTASIKREIKSKVSNSGRILSKEFPAGPWQKDEIRNRLWDSQHKKCCFCENKRHLKREFDAEHFRPKAGVTEKLEHLGYWWLAYEWDNLFFACMICNRDYKGNHFPLLEDNSRAMSDSDNLSSEKPVLINPLDEDPEKYIGFDWQQDFKIFVKATGLDIEGRGYETIKITGLNRTVLLEERAELVELLEDVVKSYFWAEREDKQGVISVLNEKIRSLTSARKRFTGFRRAYFRAYGLGQHIATD